MNRRAKIIVSVTGIFIVLLALVGLTYGYFLTQITDNDAERSIELTTANLELVYEDGNGILTPAEALIPGNYVKFKTSDGTVTTDKTFSVTNNGDDTEYVVILENVEIKNATTGSVTTFESNDFRYTLTCTNGTTPCNGITYDALPMNDGVIVGNTIAKNEEQTYTLKIKYMETSIDQSADMNKTISALINIQDIKKVNPYSGNTKSLAYNIINNSIKGTTGTKLVNTPPTKVGYENSGATKTGKIVEAPIYSPSYMWWVGSDVSVGYQNGTNVYECTESLINQYIYDERGGNTGLTGVHKIVGCDGKIPIIEQEEIEFEQVLSATTDDLGTSYYYRGRVEDNFVDFAGLCWRIVRIEGDGSVKLVLEDAEKPCKTSEGNYKIKNQGNFGINTDYTINYLHGDYQPQNSIATIFKNYQTTLNSEIGIYHNGKKIEDMLKSGNWCLDDTAYYSTDYITSTNINLMEISPLLESEKNKSVSLYDSSIRLQGNKNSFGLSPSLKCFGTVMNDFDDNDTNPTLMYVATLTADEIVYAGQIAGGVTGNYNNPYVYLLSKSSEDYGWYNDMFTLTPIFNDKGGMEDLIYFYGEYGSLDWGGRFQTQQTGGVRPAVSLKPGIEIKGGTGLKNDPYVIE